MSIERLRAIMVALRDPRKGCPWDREQSWATIAPHTLEEAYELADAIERGDVQHVRDELGDLLFQVVFQARIAEEQGLFDFNDVAATISDKLERRHPHVFGSATVRSADEQTAAFERADVAQDQHVGHGQRAEVDVDAAAGVRAAVADGEVAQPLKTICISGKLPSGRKKADYAEPLRAAGYELVDEVIKGLDFLFKIDMKCCW